MFNELKNVCVRSRRSSKWICIEFSMYAQEKSSEKEESTKPSKSINRSNRSDKTKQTHQSKLDNKHIKQKPKETPIQSMYAAFSERQRKRGSVCMRVEEKEKAKCQLWRTKKIMVILFSFFGTVI